jgi:hypothetical protein
MKAFFQSLRMSRHGESTAHRNSNDQVDVLQCTKSLLLVANHMLSMGHAWGPPALTVTHDHPEGRSLSHSIGKHSRKLKGEQQN